MKGVIFVIAVVFCWLLPVSTVYAGSLNKYEQDVIAEAKKTYIYEGREYRVPDTYINQLVNYFSSDDVDITSEQRDEALRMAYESIEQGVLEGYLVPIEELQKTQVPAATEAIPKEDTTGEDIAGEIELPIPQITEGEGEPEPTIAKPGMSPETSDEEKITEAPTGKQEEIAKVLEAIIAKKEMKKTNSDVLVGIDSQVITETGFCLDNTIIVIAGIIILMMIGLIAAFRINYFAHSDE